MGIFGFLDRFLGLFFVFSVQCALLSAGDLRTWTSAQGGIIEAKFQKVASGKVHLLTAESKVIQVKFEDLSIGDLCHLVEQDDLDRKILSELKLRIPEEVFKFNKKTLKTHEKKMVFGDDSYLQFKVLESDHFLIASSGSFRPQALAEMAERLWHGMASQHGSFRENWGVKKQVVIVAANDDVYLALGEYYSQWLLNAGAADQARATELSERNSLIWGKATGISMQISGEWQEEYDAFPIAKVFRIRDGKDASYRKAFGPFPTNELSSTLLGSQMGGSNRAAPYGYFAITRGYSFYKEIQLAGRSGTRLLDVSNYADDNEFTSVRGFEDGRSWAKTLRKLVRKGDVKPDLETLLSYTSTNLTPEQLVLIYSLGYYMQSDAEKIASFMDLIAQIRNDRGVPDAVEIAEIFGAESLEEFNKDWAEFVSSSEFK